MYSLQTHKPHFVSQAFESSYHNYWSKTELLTVKREILFNFIYSIPHTIIACIFMYSFIYYVYFIIFVACRNFSAKFNYSLEVVVHMCLLKSDASPHGKSAISKRKVN